MEINLPESQQAGLDGAIKRIALVRLVVTCDRQSKGGVNIRNRHVREINWVEDEQGRSEIEPRCNIA